LAEYGYSWIKGCLSGLGRLIRIKGRIKGIEIPAVQFFLGDSEGFTEPLVMDDLTFSQELDRFAYVIVCYYPEDVVIGTPGFLFWGDLVSTTYTKI
jgi:hypothetical protein